MIFQKFMNFFFEEVDEDEETNEVVEEEEEVEEKTKYLKQRKKLQELSTETGVSIRVVYDMFTAETYDDLTADKLIVYEAAIEKVAHLKSLPAKASSVVND